MAVNLSYNMLGRKSIKNARTPNNMTKNEPKKTSSGELETSKSLSNQQTNLKGEKVTPMRKALSPRLPLQKSSAAATAVSESY